MGKFQRQFLVALVASVPATGGAVALPGPAAAAMPTAVAAVSCDPSYTIQTSGAIARIRECHSGNTVRVDGTVTDTDADGQCGQVYASYNQYQGTDYSPRACPKGQTDSFTFPWRSGTNAYVYLREI